MEEVHKKIEELRESYKQEKARIDNDPSLTDEEKSELKSRIKKMEDETDSLNDKRDKLRLEEKQLENAIEPPSEQQKPSPSQGMMLEGDTPSDDLGLDDGPSSPDEEIGTFIREHARIKGDMVREQELVEGLSEESAEFMAKQEDTKHLFEEGYFEQSKPSQPTDHEFKTEGLNADQNGSSALALGRG